MPRTRHKPEMIEGPEAYQRFEDAVKAVLKVRKEDMPPSPFSKSSNKKTNVNAGLKSNESNL
jgi:hypothetical protein